MGLRTTMNLATANPAPAGLIVAIIGSFLVFFPLVWCGVLWLLSYLGGWHRLAQQFCAGGRPLTGECHRVGMGKVGVVRYRGVLTLHVLDDGFFMEVMFPFKVGHPRLFIPWSAISARTPHGRFFWPAEKLSIGQPVIATIALPVGLLPQHTALS
jgi:hypothetical protein